MSLSSRWKRARLHGGATRWYSPLSRGATGVFTTAPGQDVRTREAEVYYDVFYSFLIIIRSTSMVNYFVMMLIATHFCFSFKRFLYKLFIWPGYFDINNWLAWWPLRTCVILEISMLDVSEQANHIKKIYLESYAAPFFRKTPSILYFIFQVIMY